MASKELRQRRPENSEAALQQKRMIRQIQTAEYEERQQQKDREKLQSEVLSIMTRSYVQVLLFLIVLGIVLLFLFAPHLVFGRKGPKLPMRRLMTVYPTTMHINRDLPRFYQSYAIATPDNEEARQAVRKVAEMRRVATDPSRFNQKILFTAWEHEDLLNKFHQRTWTTFVDQGSRMLI